MIKVFVEFTLDDSEDKKVSINKDNIQSFHFQSGKMWVHTKERGYRVEESYDEVKALINPSQ